MWHMIFLMVFQLTAARRRLDIKSRLFCIFPAVSTHSRPKAAGTQATGKKPFQKMFQLTAARRRLVYIR